MAQIEKWTLQIKNADFAGWLQKRLKVIPLVFEQQKQMYRDSCGRNRVEGRNGNLKRRYGLDLISCKLDEKAKTGAALNIIAMNAVHRLRNWCALFENWLLWLLL